MLPLPARRAGCGDVVGSVDRSVDPSCCVLCWGESFCAGFGGAIERASDRSIVLSVHGSERESGGSVCMRIGWCQHGLGPVDREC